MNNIDQRSFRRTTFRRRSPTPTSHSSTKRRSSTQPVVTRTESNSGFFPAEDYHQDYLNSNPTAPYIAANDMPKLDALKQTFPERYREQPVLVHALTNG